MNPAAQLLTDKGIRATSIRIDVLHLLMHSSRAYTANQVKKALGRSLDRVSLYRCLLSLTGAGLIQKLIDSKGHCCYFYATPSTADIQPHFKCLSCETIVPLPQLPETYLSAVRSCRVNTIQFVAEGTCYACHNTDNTLNDD